MSDTTRLASNRNTLIGRDVRRTPLDSVGLLLDPGSSYSVPQLAAECIGQQGILVIVGLGGGSLPVGFLTMRPEATITNIYWGATSELADVLALGSAGRLVNNVTRYSLDDAQTAIDDLEHGRVAGRAVLIP